MQESLGVGVETLDMPFTAKLFVGLTALGLMVEVFQFVAYVVVATFDDLASVAAYFAWLGPVREAGLGILLSGIVLSRHDRQSTRIPVLATHRDRPDRTVKGGIEMASALQPPAFRSTVSERGLMAFPVGVVLAAVRANEVATGGGPDTIAALGHFVTAANFVGSASVFAAIS